METRSVRSRNKLLRDVRTQDDVGHGAANGGQCSLFELASAELSNK